MAIPPISRSSTQSFIMLLSRFLLQFACNPFVVISPNTCSSLSIALHTGSFCSLTSTPTIVLTIALSWFVWRGICPSMDRYSLIVTVFFSPSWMMVIGSDHWSPKTNRLPLARCLRTLSILFHRTFSFSRRWISRLPLWSSFRLALTESRPLALMRLRISVFIPQKSAIRRQVSVYFYAC